MSLISRFPVSLASTVSSHGWVRLAPWNWDTEKRELSRLECLGDSVRVTVAVHQSGIRTFKIGVKGQALDEIGKERVLHLVRRWLSLDWDPRGAGEVAKSLDADISEFINRGGGRFLRSSTFYEDFVKTICTINTNWASTIRMVASLVTDIGNGVFPSPRMVVERGEHYLRQKVKLGFRANVLVSATNELLSEKIIDNEGKLKAKRLSYEDLLSIHGVGPYSASHVAMLEHDFSHIPIDSVVSNYCKEQYGIGPKEIGAFFDLWGDYRFLGYKLSRDLHQTNTRE